MGVFGMRAGGRRSDRVPMPCPSPIRVCGACGYDEGPSGIGPDVMRKRGERMTNDTAEPDLARLARRRIIDHMDCDDCTEDYVFLMRQDDREFGIGLTTVLAALAFAEREGAVPELPADWWIKVRNQYK